MEVDVRNLSFFLHFLTLSMNCRTIFSQTDTGTSEPDAANYKTDSQSNSSFIQPTIAGQQSVDNVNSVSNCPAGLECHKLGADCVSCKFNVSHEKCRYGKNVTVACTAKKGVQCNNQEGGTKEFQKTLHCSYCYQLAEWQYTCSTSSSCTVRISPRQYYTANCTTRPDYLCLGKRVFQKRLPCNWTSGYRWSSALILSITLGGFGIDRFYLGLWREGIGKLFSFGGLGVWTIVDVVLIAIGYVGPHDGSLYVY